MKFQRRTWKIKLFERRISRIQLNSFDLFAGELFSHNIKRLLLLQQVISRDT